MGLNIYAAGLDMVCEAKPLPIDIRRQWNNGEGNSVVVFTRLLVAHIFRRELQNYQVAGERERRVERQAQEDLSFQETVSQYEVDFRVYIST